MYGPETGTGSWNWELETRTGSWKLDWQLEAGTGSWKLENWKSWSWKQGLGCGVARTGPGGEDVSLIKENKLVIILSLNTHLTTKTNTKCERNNQRKCLMSLGVSLSVFLASKVPIPNTKWTQCHSHTTPQTVHKGATPHAHTTPHSSTQQCLMQHVIHRHKNMSSLIPSFNHNNFLRPSALICALVSGVILTGTLTNGLLNGSFFCSLALFERENLL